MQSAATGCSNQAVTIHSLETRCRSASVATTVLTAIASRTRPVNRLPTDAIGGREREREGWSGSVLLRIALSGPASEPRSSEALNIDPEDNAMAFTRSLESIQKQLKWPRGDGRRGRRLSFASRPSPTITRIVGWRSTGRQDGRVRLGWLTRGVEAMWKLTAMRMDRHTEMPAR